MKRLILLSLIISLFACNQVKVDKPAFDARLTMNRLEKIDTSYYKGSSFLSVYSQIYQRNKEITYDLTVMVSMRNYFLRDTVFISKATYYNTNGSLIAEYIKKPIYLAPMETIEIIINEDDSRGGTGGNFLFDWYCKYPDQEPLFEAVMTSTAGQQGISFVTQGFKTNHKKKAVRDEP